MENISEVFQKEKRKKVYEETELYNSLSFDRRLPVVKKCLEKCLLV